MMTEDVRTALSRWAHSGDATALSPILEHCRPRLLAVIRGKLPLYLRTEVAEDIVQDALTKAAKKIRDDWEKIQHLDWQDQDAFCAWLLAFACNSLRDWRKHIARLRKHYREILESQGADDASASGPGLLEAAAGDDKTPSKYLRCQEKKDALWKAMETYLEPRERQAVVLFHIKRRKATEIAELLGCSPGNVRTLCCRARETLRQALGNSSQFFSGR